MTAPLPDHHPHNTDTTGTPHAHGAAGAFQTGPTAEGLSRRMMLARSAFVAGGLAAMGAGFGVGLTGCAVSRRMARNKWRFVVPIEGDPIMLGQLAALDLENHLGSVQVIGDQNQLQAEVEIRVRQLAGVDRLELQDLNKENWFATQTVDDNGRRTLRVLVRGVDGLSETVESDVIVRMPSVDGLAVRNAGGIVSLKNVAGAIQVENGRGSLPGGRIVCLTERPLIDPVTMLTTSGQVVLGCPPESRGSVELLADQGRVVMQAPEARLAEVRPEQHRWTGVINRGESSMVLRSLDSDVRMFVVPRPLQVDTTRIY